MNAALDRLQALAVPVPTPKVRGQWFNIRFTPDLAGGELFNIGVGYLDAERQTVQARLIENLEAFRTLFGEAFEEEIRFSLDVVRSAFGQKLLDSPIGSVVFGERRFAAGESVQEVLARLFSATVSFSEAKLQPFAKRESAHGNPAARKAVFDVIRLKADLRADRIIAGDPIYLARDGAKIYPLDIPLRSDRHLGSVVSGAYRTKQPLENNLLRASLDLETAARIFKQDKLGYFVLRQEAEGTGFPVDRSFDEVIDTVGWKLHKHGIHVGVEDTPERLADDILNWSGI